MTTTTRSMTKPDNPGLVLTRHRGESVDIYVAGEYVATITVLHARSGKAKVHFAGPAATTFLRGEHAHAKPTA